MPVKRWNREQLWAARIDSHAMMASVCAAPPNQRCVVRAGQLERNGDTLFLWYTLWYTNEK